MSKRIIRAKKGCFRSGVISLHTVEHAAVNRVVVGSSPTGGAKEKPYSMYL